MDQDKGGNKDAKVVVAHAKVAAESEPGAEKEKVEKVHRGDDGGLENGGRAEQHAEDGLHEKVRQPVSLLSHLSLLVQVMLSLVDVPGHLQGHRLHAETCFSLTAILIKSKFWSIRIRLFLAK